MEAIIADSTLVPTLLLLSGDGASVAEMTRTGWQDRGKQEQSVGNRDKTSSSLQVSIVYG